MMSLARWGFLSREPGRRSSLMSRSPAPRSTRAFGSRARFRCIYGFSVFACNASLWVSLLDFTHPELSAGTQFNLSITPLEFEGM